MNATALASSVNRLIDKFGNTIVYYPPKTTSIYYNDEGDWTPTYQTTTTQTRWVESDRVNANQFTDFGMLNVKEGTMLMRNDVSIQLKGKCVSDNISWEIMKIRPIRVKDTNILFEVEVKNII